MTEQRDDLSGLPILSLAPSAFTGLDTALAQAKAAGEDLPGAIDRLFVAFG